MHESPVRVGRGAPRVNHRDWPVYAEGRWLVVGVEKSELGTDWMMEKVR